MDVQSIKSSAWGMVADKRFILTISVAAIFICVAIYVWRNYISDRVNPKYVPNKEFVEDGVSGGSMHVKLYFFYTVWCPHCKNAKPEWEKLKDYVATNKVKGRHIEFIEVDCDKDTATAEKFNVSSYPTIKLLDGDRVVEYDAKPDIDTLRQFLNASL